MRRYVPFACLLLAVASTVSASGGGGGIGAPLSTDGTNVTLASGQLRLPDGTAGAPSLSFANQLDAGLSMSGGAGAVDLSVAGTVQMRWRNGNTDLATQLRFGPNVNAIDAIFLRDAPNTFAMRNGTNAQLLNIYNTFTDANNYERLAIGYIGNVAKFLHQNAGTGVARAMRIETNSGILELHDGNSILTISSSTLTVGNRGIAFTTDNTFDVGAVASSRPRTGYFGTSVVSPVFSIPTGGSTTISTGVGSIKMSTVNAATNAAWIPITYAGTVYYVPAFTTNAP